MLIRSWLKIILCAAIFFPIMLSISCLSLAAEWSAEPSISTNREYNTNIRLTTQPHNSVTGTTLSPKLNLGVRSDIWQVNGGAEFVQKRFSGESDLDRDDHLFNLSTSYNAERSTWALKGASTKTSTITDQVTSTTGLSQVQRVQDERSVTPSLTWLMTELTQLQLTYSLRNLSYVNGASAGLYDYSSRSISATLTNRLAVDYQVFFVAGHSIFRMPSRTLGLSYDSKSVNYQMGMTRIFSETLRGTLAVGARETSVEQGVCRAYGLTTLSGSLLVTCFQSKTQISKESSSVFNGSFEKQFEVLNLTATLSRSLDASALGGQVETDSLYFHLERPVTEKWMSLLDVNAYKTHNIQEDISSGDRRFYSLQPKLIWQWTPEWQTSISYSYIHMKRAHEPTAVTASSVYLSLRYTWPKMSIPR